MSKIQKFITINKHDFMEEFKNFRVITNTTTPTLNQRDAYYIVINGNLFKVITDNYRHV